MFTVDNNNSFAKQPATVAAGAGVDHHTKVLCERLLNTQPQSEPLLKRLLGPSRQAGGLGAFARIEDGRCSACNVTVALARIQRAKAGEFINCANCIRFLYYDPR